MHQLGTKHLQVLAQFFQLMLGLFFEVGSFRNLVTKMNVHERFSGGKAPTVVTLLWAQFTPVGKQSSKK
jgi:hypothetical protein